jgi:ribonucleoside-diphosphate reductase alpha chain
MLYSSANEYATCNLSSINLAKFVVDTHSPDGTDADRTLDHKFPVRPVFDYIKLMEITRLIVRNLNRVIDCTDYPVKKCWISNVKHRPLGIGVQGLANVYCKMKYAFDSKEASILNKKIFEVIYFAALSESAIMCRNEYLRLRNIAKQQGYVDVTVFDCDTTEEAKRRYDADDLPKTIYSYPSMLYNGGSPISKGIFHFEMFPDWNPSELSGICDWETLRDLIKEFGVRNSQLIALMPTASTSQLLGNNECFEPFTHNIYVRKTLAGNYYVVNEYLVNDLIQMGMWDTKMMNAIMMLNGSIQKIGILPQKMKNMYKTAFELDQGVLIQQAIDRQRFVDQAQSLNLYYEKFNSQLFTQHMFEAWGGYLKTGKYYVHTSAGAEPIKFSILPSVAETIIRDFKIETTIPIKKEVTIDKTAEAILNNHDDNEPTDVCLACSS